MAKKGHGSHHSWTTPRTDLKIAAQSVPHHEAICQDLAHPCLHRLERPGVLEVLGSHSCKAKCGQRGVLRLRAWEERLGHAWLATANSPLHVHAVSTKSFQHSTHR